MPEGNAAGHRRLHLHHELASNYLPEKRDLIVYTPPAYEREPERRYPVLYLHDGQNLFDGETSFIKGRTWQVREHADAAIAAGEVEPLVIVGIYNTGDRRLAEYTHERSVQMGGGEAEDYGLMSRCPAESQARSLRDPRVGLGNLQLVLDRDVLGAELIDRGQGTWAYRFGTEQLNVHGPGAIGDP